MAHLWVRHDGVEWAVLPLDGDAFNLNVSPPRRQRWQRVSRGRDSQAVLLRSALVGEGWVLLAGLNCDIRVNGARVAAGIRVLSDRDEIRVGGVDTYFFSTEKLATVESLPKLPRSGFCPRCKQEIVEGTPAVQCPRCKVWHHQTEELPCWTYAKTCALDEQATDLEGEYRWTPKDL